MTAGYANVNEFIVIFEARRDPDVSWAQHLARGSAGGVDCVAQVGMPIYAPADCYVSNTPNNGNAGNTITLSFSDGWRDQMMHLSRFVTPGQKSKGALIGFSGDSGSPGAPHVHWHRIDPSGVRRNPWNYFTGATVSAVKVTPITNTPALSEEDDMADLYFRRQATGTVAVFGADFRDDKLGAVGRHEFGSVGEYASWRNALVTTNSEIDRLGLDPRGKRYVPPAAPGHVVGLDELGWGVVCGVYGV